MQYDQHSANGFRLSASHDDDLQTHVLGVPASDGWLVVAAQVEEMELVGSEPIGWAANMEGALKRAEKFADDYEVESSGGGILSAVDDFGKSLIS